jgi:ribonuclease HI
MSRIPANNPKGTYVCFFDGAAWPNPGGVMGQGVVIKKDGQVVCYKNRQAAHPDNTNNCSEYLALILLLSKFKDRQGCKIRIYGDSNLVVSQMSGEYRIGKGKYVEYARKAEKLMHSICKNNSCRIYWIPREENWEADKLSNT